MDDDEREKRATSTHIPYNSQSIQSNMNRVDSMCSYRLKHQQLIITTKLQYLYHIQNSTKILHWRMPHTYIASGIY